MSIGYVGEKGVGKGIIGLGVESGKEVASDDDEEEEKEEEEDDDEVIVFE